MLKKQSKSIKNKILLSVTGIAFASLLFPLVSHAMEAKAESSTKEASDARFPSIAEQSLSAGMREANDVFEQGVLEAGEKVRASRALLDTKIEKAKELLDAGIMKSLALLSETKAEITAQLQSTVAIVSAESAEMQAISSATESQKKATVAVEIAEKKAAEAVERSVLIKRQEAMAKKTADDMMKEYIAARAKVKAAEALVATSVTETEAKAAAAATAAAKLAEETKLLAAETAKAASQVSTSARATEKEAFKAFQELQALKALSIEAAQVKEAKIVKGEGVFRAESKKLSTIYSEGIRSANMALQTANEASQAAFDMGDKDFNAGKNEAKKKLDDSSIEAKKVLESAMSEIQLDTADEELKAVIARVEERLETLTKATEKVLVVFDASIAEATMALNGAKNLSRIRLNRAMSELKARERSLAESIGHLIEKEAKKMAAIIEKE